MIAGCWANFGLRLLLLPVFAVKGILQLPYSYVEEEPSRSGAYGAKASLAAASGSTTNGKAHAASAAGLPGTSEPLRVTLIGKPEIQFVLRRLRDMWHASLLLLYTALPYNILVAFVKLLGAGVVLTWLQPHLQWFLSLFIGKYQLEKPVKGTTEVLYSVANSVDTNFALPAGYNKFPFDAPPSSHEAGLSPDQVKAARIAEGKRAHLGGMAAKLAYEDPLVIRDAVTRWGFTFLTDQQADHTASTVPQTYYYTFYNDHAVIICFRGTSPLNLINWQTDIDLGMSHYAGFGGVHDGFYNALFDKARNKQSLQDGFSTTPDTVFGAAVKAVTEAHGNKPIYICGHSLGGALTAVFAVALAVPDAGVHPDVSKRIAGIMTYGEPREGDDDFASNFDNRFGSIARRYVHGADIVPRVPVGLGYLHHGEERFIPSFDVSDNGRVLTNDDEIRYWDARETRPVVALWNSLLKLLWSQWPPPESKLHTLTRCCLLLLPGLLDHFPGDYETLLRADVARRIAAPPPAY